MKSSEEIKSADGPSTQIDHKREVKASRNDLQWGRRLFHFSMGTMLATAYALFLSHQTIVYSLGTIATLFYIFEQIRINYPETASKLNIVSKYLLRAEEQLEESSAIPYAMAVLLTILTFPKEIAIGAITTLAISDPLSAIIGIKFGKHKVVEGKSIEGSIAFFLATFGVILFTFSHGGVNLGIEIWGLAFLVAFFGALFEMIPLRIDDNLTIPLFTAFTSWFFCLLFEIPLV